MKPEDICELTGVIDPRVSPDGRTVAFVVWRVDKDANEYKSNIWLTSVDGSLSARQLTFGDRRDAAPRWSPDGSRIAFTSNRGDKAMQLYLMPVGGGGEARKLTAFKEDVGQAAWSPDGSRIAFASRVRADYYDIEDEKKRPPRRITRLFYKLDNEGWTADRRHHIFTVAADGSGAPVQLTSGDYEDGKPAWSPDGSTLAFVSARHEDWDIHPATDVYVVPATGGEPIQLTKMTGLCDSPSWSPDGSTIAFQYSHGIFDSPRHIQIAVIPAAGGIDLRNAVLEQRRKVPLKIPKCLPPGFGEKVELLMLNNPELKEMVERELAGNPVLEEGAATSARQPVWNRAPNTLTASLDRNCGPYPEIREPIWVGSDLLFAVEDHGNTHVYRVAANGAGTPEMVISGELCITGYDAAAGVIVHTATTPTSLSELYSGDRQLTHVGKAFTEVRTLCVPERFTAVSTDGSKVDAWFIRPAGFEEGKKYPLLLNIHGGPFTQFGNRFFDEFQVYAAAGYAVVFSNPRGSSGYSEAWGRAIRGPVEGGPGWGSVDYEDVMAVVDEAIRRFDVVDSNRLGVMGGSYGGYMTSWIVGHTDRFRVAISERAVNDILSEGGASDISIWWKAITGVHYWEQPEVMRRISPATYAKNIKTPLLIIHSENDLRCPISQGEDLFTRLRVLKREVEFVRFPAESHELSRSGSPYHRMKRFEIILDWLGRYLKSSSA